MWPPSICLGFSPPHRTVCSAHSSENWPPHSITSAARASSVGGTSRPSVLAVFKLITSSYLVGACTAQNGVLCAQFRELAASLDHLVGAGQQCRRHLDAERFGGL